MLFLIRYGELTLKAKRARAKLLSLLERNLRASLAARGVFYDLKVEWSRAYLETEDPRAGAVVSRSFGISSYSRVNRVPFEDMGDLVSLARDHFRDMVRDKRFAVRVKRRGKHPFSSMDMERALGAALEGFARGVDLTEPEITCHLEIRGQEAWLFTDIHQGPGGLPPGAGPRVLVLYSGGFDSGVAAWMMMKKGCPVDFLFFNLGGQEHLSRAARGASFLAENWAGAETSSLMVVDFSEILRQIRKKVSRSYWNMALKRMFYLAGERVAARGGYPSLVTGESVGQVSTQTLPNLVALTAGLSVPVMRPLLCMDKEEILALARRIGTYTISEGLTEYCDLAGGHPVTRSTPERLERHIRALDPALVDEALSRAETLGLPTTLGLDEDMEIDHVPPGAVLVDLRSKAQYDAWHPEGALLVRYDDLEAGLFQAKNTEVYVFYCEHALKSLDAARLLRQRGIKAYSLKGGTKTLLKKI